MKRLLYLVAEDSYFCSHRLELAATAVANGYAVAVATVCNKHGQQITSHGIKLFSLKYFCRSRINLFRDFLALIELYDIYKTFKPDIVHHVAVKPIIYGTIVAKLCKIPKIINALAGLGYLFTDFSDKKLISLKQRLLHKLVCKIFKYIFQVNNSILVLQNKDDYNTLVAAKCGALENTKIIFGSGINTSKYPYLPMPDYKQAKTIKIVCVSRLLWTKGIAELIEAAGFIKKQQKNYKLKNLDLNLEFLLYGSADKKNPAVIPIVKLQQWHNQKIINWQGFCDDTAKAYADGHIAVLPSYREGLPKTLLEAASCGRPIITTDVPGCREIVTDGVNGYLVPARDSMALANSLIKLISSQDDMLSMGQASRNIAQTKFSSQVIHSQFLSLY